MLLDRVRIRPLVAAICLGLTATPAWADGDDIDALRDRVAELERMVQALMAANERTRSDLADTQARTDETVRERVAAAVAELEKPVEPAGDPAHTYAFGGYIKSDLILSSYSDGDLAPASAGRDFYIPGTIPVGGTDESTDFDAHAKESRIFFKSDHVLDSGDKVGTYIEMDFLLPPSGDERVSNSYNPRLRHAFVRYNNWLAGQTWSTFQNVGALAENLDFVGPADGTIFERQAQLRYTSGPWQFALENPETTVTPFGGGGRIVTDDGGVPDVVGRYEAKGDWGNFVVAGILRNLEYEDAASGIDDSDTGFGLSLSGKHPLGEQNDFRWMLSGGSGMGRYIGLNTANGAVITADGSLDAIDSFGGFASYRHFWTPQWRSNVTLSFLDIDNDVANTGLGVTESVESLHLNLIYSPIPKFDFGIEYLHATRELESGADGDLDRLQFSTKFSF